MVYGGDRWRGIVWVWLSGKSCVRFAIVLIGDNIIGILRTLSYSAIFFSEAGGEGNV